MAEHNAPLSVGTREPQIQPSAIPVPLTIQYAPRTVMVHPVTSTELDTVASLSNSLHFVFFGICCGGAISFGIVLSTGKISDPMINASYVALLAVSAIGAVYFGLRAIIDYRAARRKLNELKSGRS